MQEGAADADAAGAAAGARSGSGCAEQPGEVGQKWSGCIRSDAGSLKWSPQTDPTEKMAHEREQAERCNTGEEDGRREKLTHAVRVFGRGVNL